MGKASFYIFYYLQKIKMKLKKKKNKNRYIY